MINFRCKLTSGIAGLTFLLLTGCDAPKDVAYFQDVTDNYVVEASQKQITIRPGDKISIVVKTRDPKIADLFNMTVYSNRTGQNASVNGTGATLLDYSTPSGESMSAFTVDSKGNIDFPVLGEIHVAGMTRKEVASTIKKDILDRQLAKDPVVTVEFLSAGFNVLGNVNKPGRYDLNRDELNLLEALSLASDLKLTGQRQNIRVVRKEDGQLHSYVIDLTDLSKAVKSPGFYIQQDDMIYVEPNEMDKRSTKINGNNVMQANFWISVASVMTSIVTTIAVLKK